MTATGCWIGTYTAAGTHARDIQGEGILRGWIDDASGKLSIKPAKPEARDPSYLALGKGQLFAVSEKMGEPGEVLIYQIADDDELKLDQRLASGGRNACFITTHGPGLLVANYMTPQLSIFEPISSHWRMHLGEIYHGTGPDRVRQEKPHPHHCAYLPVSGHVAVCDLGADRVWLHAATADTVEPAVAASITLPPGTGPRHLVVNGPHLYVLGELTGQLHHFTWDGTKWKHAHTCPPVNARPWCAAIHRHPTAPVLFVSERNASEIHGFTLEAETGRPIPDQHIASPAKTPRDFGITPDGRWLLVLGQDSSTIAVHAIDPKTGRMQAAPSSVHPCGSPVCIVMDDPSQ